MPGHVLLPIHVIDLGQGAGHKFGPPLLLELDPLLLLVLPPLLLLVLPPLLLLVTPLLLLSPLLLLLELPAPPVPASSLSSIPTNTLHPTLRMNGIASPNSHTYEFERLNGIRASSYRETHYADKL